MKSDNTHLAIIAIVERGKAKAIVEAAQRAGASGATILFARGTGTAEHLNLFRIKVDAMKEVLIILAENEQVQTIFEAVSKAGRLAEPGAGIAFTLPVGMIAGLEHRNLDEVALG